MAYTKGDGVFHTFRASTGLKQYSPVEISGANNLLIEATTGGQVIGVLVSSGTTGSTGRAGSTDSGSVQTVQLFGISKVIAGTTTIDAGDMLKATTDGRASTWDVTDGSTDFVFGRALGTVNSTSTSGEIITAAVNCMSFGVYGGVSTA